MDRSKTVIYDLSNEILISVFEYAGLKVEEWPEGSGKFHTVQHPQTILKVAKCSRRFFQLAEPLLYTQFRVSNLNTPARYGTLFLSRILARPDLALRVREIGPFELGQEPFEPELRPVLTKDDEQRIADAVAALPLAAGDAPKEWLSLVQQGKFWDECIALILMLVPNLELLEVANYSRDSYLQRPNRLKWVIDHIAALQRRPNPPARALLHLRKLSVANQQTDYPIELQNVFDLISLQSVVSLSVYRVSESGIADPDLEEELQPGWIKKPPRLTTVKEVRLHHSNIDHLTLRAFLQCFPQVETFCYEEAGADVGVASFEPPHIMKALEHLKPCLRELRITNDEPEMEMNFLEWHPLGALTDFQLLETVETPMTMLIGNTSTSASHFITSQNLVDSLPSTLRSLTIRDCTTDIVSHITDLLANTSRYPSLRILNLQWETIHYPDKPSPRKPFNHQGFTPEEASQFLQKCDELGINMVLQKVLPPAKQILWWEYLPRNVPSGLEIPPSITGFDDDLIPYYTEQLLPYPYTDYEKICEEHDCDPATGRPRNQPAWITTDIVDGL